MRIEHRFLSWSENNRAIKKATLLLDKFSKKYSYEEDLESALPSSKYGLEVKIYEDEDHSAELIQKLKSFDFLHQVSAIDEKKDIKNAQWFWMSSGAYQYPQPEDNFGYLNTSFNLDKYCSTCGMVKTQNNPIRLKKIPKQHKKQFWGVHWIHDAIFVRPEARKLLESEKIKGVTFKKVMLHKKNSEIVDFYQLIINTELDKGLVTEDLQTVTCKYMNEEDVEFEESERNSKDSNFCGSIKYHFPIRSGITFKKSIFEGAPEIVKSKEYFGSGAKAFKLTLVSKRIKELIEVNKLKGLTFRPMYH